MIETLHELAAAVAAKGRDYWATLEPRVTSYDGPVCLENLLRGASFQVERITAPAGHTVRQHRHPDVDTIEFALAGAGSVWLNRREFYMAAEGPFRGLRISSRSWHGGKAGPEGAVFLSVQHWRIPFSASIQTNWIDR